MTLCKCDLCGALYADAKITIERERTFLDEDEEGKSIKVVRRIKEKRDLCTGCAIMIELLFSGDYTLTEVKK